ncbi:unnamed protein product [Hymenolepis diminuta]|uniref:Uncharacterized protein n=1 Tax=Hymenolepis diminuta TaxID=6216 RepID=A0A564Y2G2_HYMDI|nr:unnamed protein product [Hymenolepis diminuta]
MQPVALRTSTDMCARASSTNQQSRSLQLSMVLYLKTKFLRHKNNEVVNKPSPLSIFLVLTTVGIA